LPALLPLVLILLFPVSCVAGVCIPIAEARQHIGEEQWVSGTVIA
jgi:hypothetical protein